jgi:hypothetical protein
LFTLLKFIFMDLKLPIYEWLYNRHPLPLRFSEAGYTLIPMLVLCSYKLPFFSKVLSLEKRDSNRFLNFEYILQDSLALEWSISYRKVNYLSRPFLQFAHPDITYCYI